MPDPVASQWSDVDLAWLGPPTAAGPDFPIECLPPAVREMVAAFAEQRRLPVDFVAAAVLGAASAAIGKRARLVTYDGRSEALALFIAIIGWPGSGKTSALDIAEAPLMRIEEALVEAYRAQLSGGTRLSRLAEQLRPTVSRRLVFEGIDIDNMAEAGEDAPPPALLLSEWTAAGLIEELRHGRDGRTIFADELTGALAGTSG